MLQLFQNKKITEEYKALNRSPLVNFGITVGLYDEDNIFEWKCTILGPKDTYYKGGLFYLKILFPNDYPNTKPEIVFLTPIYHLNVKYFVSPNQPLGHICVNTLNQWNPGDSIKKILPELFTLMHQNNPDSPYDDGCNSRRNEYVNNRELFKKKQDISQKSMQHLTQKRKNIQMVGIFLIMTKISFNFSLPM